MDVEAGEVDAGPEPMTLDRFQEGEQGYDDDDQEGDTWLNNLILQTQLDMWNMFCLREIGSIFPVGEGESDHFVEDFGGQKVCVDIPVNSVDELMGAALSFEQVKQGMLTEVQQLERLKVGCCLVERKGRELAKEKRVTVLTSRWVLTQKTADIARCRIWCAQCGHICAHFFTGRTQVRTCSFSRGRLESLNSRRERCIYECSG